MASCLGISSAKNQCCKRKDTFKLQIYVWNIPTIKEIFLGKVNSDQQPLFKVLHLSQISK